MLSVTVKKLIFWLENVTIKAIQLSCTIVVIEV